MAFGAPMCLTGILLTSPPQGLGPGVALYGMFATLGLPLWWEMNRFLLIASPLGMEHRSPWKKPQFIAWSEVEKVTYSSFNHWFVVRAWGGRRLRVSILIAGLHRFLDECEQRLPPSALLRAAAGYAEVGRTIPACSGLAGEPDGGYPDRLGYQAESASSPVGDPL